MKPSLLIAFSALAFGSSARLYDLETGNMITLDIKGTPMTLPFSGHGRISGSLASGKKVAGEFQTVGDQHGAAILVGDGIVIDCEYYVAGNGNGTGTCQDNEKRRYRLMF